LAQGVRFASFSAMTAKTIAKTITKTTTAKVTTVKTTKPKTYKSDLRKTTAEKRAAGKTAMKAHGKKMALAQKKKGVGIFAPKTLSADLSAICNGKKSLSRVAVNQAVWAYIKAKKLSKGRIVSPDATLKKVFPKSSLSFFRDAQAFVCAFEVKRAELQRETCMEGRGLVLDLRRRTLFSADPRCATS